MNSLSEVSRFQTNVSTLRTYELPINWSLKNVLPEVLSDCLNKNGNEKLAREDDLTQSLIEQIEFGKNEFYRIDRAFSKGFLISEKMSLSLQKINAFLEKTTLPFLSRLEICCKTPKDKEIFNQVVEEAQGLLQKDLNDEFSHVFSELDSLHDDAGDFLGFLLSDEDE